MVDRSLSPNAENLNFAVRADAVLDPDHWDFSAGGRKHLDVFLAAQQKKSAK
jgi:hypothetical protein